MQPRLLTPDLLPRFAALIAGGATPRRAYKVAVDDDLPDESASKLTENVLRLPNVRQAISTARQALPPPELALHIGPDQ